MSRTDAALSRRNLLAAAAAAAAGGALVGAVRHAPVAPGAASAAPRAGGGYRLTEHVQRYYRSTRV